MGGGSFWLMCCFLISFLGRRFAFGIAGVHAHAHIGSHESNEASVCVFVLTCVLLGSVIKYTF
eukprot:m.338036 g.338036  ORF g.338036 m.338036 type:complete len:63 (-) comp19809_c1_seq12:71-259(-)